MRQREIIASNKRIFKKNLDLQFLALLSEGVTRLSDIMDHFNKRGVYIPRCRLNRIAAQAGWKREKFSQIFVKV